MKIPNKVRTVLGKPDATAADIQAALDELDVPGLEAFADDAERKRAALLLDGTDRQLDAADAAWEAAKRERDRGVASKAELRKRLAAAEAASAASALDAEREAVEREAEEVKRLLLERLVPLQREIVGILLRLKKAEDAVERTNEKMFAAGRGEPLGSVEVRAFPVPPTLYAPAYSVRRITTLRHIAPGAGYNSAGSTALSPSAREE